MSRIGKASIIALALTALADPAAGQGAADVPLRMPSRGGTVAVKVSDYDAARESVQRAALRQGAELLDARTEVSFQGKKHGWMRFRLAADRLPLLLTAIHAAGKLYAENLTSAEHASEYEELERRIGRLREHQQRLAAVLESKRRLRGSDILYLQERLFRAGVDEGMLLQRRLDLERSARVSTLVIELFEPEPRRTLDLGNYYAGAALQARLALHRLLARGLTAGAYVVAFAPFWIPALVLVCALFLRIRLWRRRRAVIA
jgi:hypothetical protein